MIYRHALGRACETRAGIYAVSINGAFPYAVLGAAMMTDANGIEFVLAVVHDPDTKTEKLLRKRYLTVSNFSNSIVPVLSGATVESLGGQPDWELLAEIPFDGSYPDLGSEQVMSPWFFSGDGSKASTSREKRISRMFDSNRCDDQYVYTCADVDSGFPAGAYEVSVLDRYELSIPDVGAAVSNKGYEIGDKAESGLEYDDDQLLILNTRNLPYTTLASDSSWLYVNDDPLLNRSVYDCKHPWFPIRGTDNYACRPVEDTTFARTGFPGFLARTRLQSIVHLS